jgi:homoserine dehydrogenase
MTIPRVQDIRQHRCRFYLRFSVPDRGGVLGKLASALGNHEVSIEQMVQEGHGTAEPVAVVMLTHPAHEGNVRSALEEISALDLVTAPPRALRIEDL